MTHVSVSTLARPVFVKDTAVLVEMVITGSVDGRGSIDVRKEAKVCPGGKVNYCWRGEIWRHWRLYPVNRTQ